MNFWELGFWQAGFWAADFWEEVLAPVDPPVNGPSGGANWLSGYRPLFSYAPKKKKRNRNDLLLLKV